MTTTFAVRVAPITPTGTGNEGGTSPAFFVVGYDGSPAAQAALRTAADRLRGCSGHLAVVFVTHISGMVALSPQALVGMRLSLNDEARRLEAEVRAALDDREPRWHFERRDGAVPGQLSAVASTIREAHGSATNIVIVIGGSRRRLRLLTKPIRIALVRAAGFPVLVVPTP